jgi:site-specific DNA-cytosine methylase
MKKINVISLFNGMNTLRQAMENIGIKVDKYYSSEIKPYAIELTQHHFPDTIQVGNILNWREWDIDWSTIDFIGSGSPCQDLSAAGKRAGINGKKSSLFFVFVEILEHCKSLNPNVKFLQENVGSASKLDVGIMSRALGVYPVRINSSLLTAQLRDRYYWSNIKTKETMFDLVTDIPQPKDKGILLKDILTSGYSDRDKSLCLLEGYDSKKPKNEIEKFIKRYEMGMLQIVYKDEKTFLRVKEATKKGFTDVASNECVDLSYPESTTRRGRLMKDKSNCILRNNQYFVFEKDSIRMLNKIELCRLQGFSDNYLDTLKFNKASSLLGDGWTLPVIEHILKFWKL